MAVSKPTAEHRSASRSPTLRRRIAFRILAVLLAWGAIEVGSLFILFLQNTSVSALHEEQRQIADQEDMISLVGEEVLHPYTGYALNHEHLDYVNPYGFARMDEDIPQRGPDRLVVGVTGGSVALELCRQGGDTLRQQLRQAYPDREIVLNCFAVQGYRQPQQVMAATYLHYQGAQFDVIVNLDGFNEIALAPVEDPDSRTHDTFPRRWASRVSGIRRDPRLQASLTMRAVALRDARQRAAAAFSRPPWRCSPTLLLCWKLRNDKYLFDLDRISRKVAHENLDHERNLPFVATGPPNAAGNPVDRMQRLADQWYRGSVELNRICESTGTTYVHVLQPNQYVPDSKPLSPDDEFAPDHVYRAPVVDGYPLLRQRGAELSEQRIHFADATMIFSNVTEPIYSDECCHLNQRGYDLLARFVAKEIAAARGK